LNRFNSLCEAKKIIAFRSKHHSFSLIDHTVVDKKSCQYHPNIYQTRPEFKYRLKESLKRKRIQRLIEKSKNRESSSLSAKQNLSCQDKKDFPVDDLLSKDMIHLSEDLKRGKEMNTDEEIRNSIDDIAWIGTRQDSLCDKHQYTFSQERRDESNLDGEKNHEPVRKSEEIKSASAELQPLETPRPCRRSLRVSNLSKGISEASRDKIRKRNHRIHNSNIMQKEQLLPDLSSSLAIESNIMNTWEENLSDRIDDFNKNLFPYSSKGINEESMRTGSLRPTMNWFQNKRPRIKQNIPSEIKNHFPSAINPRVDGVLNANKRKTTGTFPYFAEKTLPLQDKKPITLDSLFPLTDEINNES